MRAIARIKEFVAAALLVGLSAASGAAQVVTSGSKGSDTNLFEPIFSKAYVMPAAAGAHIEKGDLLVGEQRYGKGRVEYRAAVDIMRAEGEFPAVPLRRIASSYYYEGKYQRAIAALDRLAKEAAEVGDVVTQAWAQADAAWVLGKDCFRNNRPGAKLEVFKRVKRLERVLDSPNLPEAERAAITANRCDGCHAVELDRRSELTCYSADV